MPLNANRNKNDSSYAVASSTVQCIGMTKTRTHEYPSAPERHRGSPKQDDLSESNGQPQASMVLDTDVTATVSDSDGMGMKLDARDAKRNADATDGLGS